MPSTSPCWSAVFLHKITLPPYVPYIHLLVDYHFGFIKRALIGAIVSLFAAKVPVWLVFALGGAIWLVTLGSVRGAVSAERSASTRKHLPLFVFMAGSPFFLKNFMHTLGHFDIYGCAARDRPAADPGALDPVRVRSPRCSR